MLTTYQAKLSSCVSGVSGLPTDSDNLQPTLKALVTLSVAFPLCCLTFRGAITRKTMDFFFVKMVKMEMTRRSYVATYALLRSSKGVFLRSYGVLVFSNTASIFLAFELRPLCAPIELPSRFRRPYYTTLSTLMRSHQNARRQR